MEAASVEEGVRASSRTENPDNVRETVSERDSHHSPASVFLRRLHRRQIGARSHEGVSAPSLPASESNQPHAGAVVLPRPSHPRGLLSETPVYIEFGAGRGMLSLGVDFCLNGCLPTDPAYPAASRGKYLLIDMSPVRFKADRWLRHKESDFQRVTGNIRDIDLRQVPIFRPEANRHIVGIAKHLCGVATDYTIRCVLNAMKEGPAPGLDVDGVCIETCCHHRCQWHSFVGREVFEELVGEGEKCHPGVRRGRVGLLATTDELGDEYGSNGEGMRCRARSIRRRRSRRRVLRR